jgi:hypothetical protein
VGFALKSLATEVTEPVTLSDMKAHLALSPDFTDDDDLITSLISAARQDAEDYLGRSLVQQQWLFALDSFPTFFVGNQAPSIPSYDSFGNFTGLQPVINPQSIQLPRPPLVSVDKVQYVDVTNTMQTLDPSTYQVDTISQPGRLLPAWGAQWPATAAVANAVEITFTAGTGVIPPNTILAIKLRAATYYANREEYMAGNPTTDSVFERMLGSQGRTNIFGYVGRR